MLILNLVSHFASIDQFFYKLFNLQSAVGDFFDNLQVALRHLFCLVLREDFAHVGDNLQELTLIAGCHRDDVVHGEITENTCLNLNLFGVSFPFHFVASHEFLLAHHAQALEHLNAGWVEITLKNDWTRFLYIESTLLCLHYPFIAIAIAIETDRTTSLDVLANDVEDSMELSSVACVFAIFRKGGIFSDTLIHTFLEID